MAIPVLYAFLLWLNLMADFCDFVSWAGGLLGIRIGEASNPGPPEERRSRSRTPPAPTPGQAITTDHLGQALAQLRVDIRSDVATELTNVQDRLSTVEQDTAAFRATRTEERLSYRARVLAATEKALLCSGSYPQTIILSNWTDNITRAEKEKWIADTLSAIKKKTLKLDFLPGIIRVKFESEETAVAFRKAWRDKAFKNSTGAPIFAVRDAPKEVRQLRADLRAVAKAFKKHAWEEKTKQKIEIRWEEGGVIYSDQTAIATRRDDGEITFASPNLEEIYKKYRTKNTTTGGEERPAKSARQG